MSNVIFEDFTIQVQEAMDEKINIALEECAGELESQVKRNTRVKSAKTKNSWKHTVDKGSHTAIVGSNDENAIWEEFGTGSYAEKGGRMGYWVFVAGENGGGSRRTNGKAYTLEEAKRVMAYLRSKGLEAYYTKGKRPSKAFRNAYEALKPKIIKHIQNSLKG
jgi:hypothetical protein